MTPSCRDLGIESIAFSGYSYSVSPVGLAHEQEVSGNSTPESRCQL